jgi:acylphosphatase
LEFLTGKRGCAGLSKYGFIPVVRTGGEVYFTLGSRPVVAHGVADSIVNRKRVKIFYSGSVQGVGFRYTVTSVAAGFEVAGTVRNLPDGRVELVAEGAKDELEAFRQAIRDSGLAHFVRKEDVSWAEATNEFRGFEIARSM